MVVPRVALTGHVHKVCPADKDVPAHRRALSVAARAAAETSGGRWGRLSACPLRTAQSARGRRLLCPIDVRMGQTVSAADVRGRSAAVRAVGREAAGGMRAECTRQGTAVCTRAGDNIFGQEQSCTDAETRCVPPLEQLRAPLMRRTPRERPLKCRHRSGDILRQTRLHGVKKV